MYDGTMQHETLKFGVARKSSNIASEPFTGSNGNKHWPSIWGDIGYSLDIPGHEERGDNNNWDQVGIKPIPVEPFLKAQTRNLKSPTTMGVPNDQFIEVDASNLKQLYEPSLFLYEKRVQQSQVPQLPVQAASSGWENASGAAGRYHAKVGEQGYAFSNISNVVNQVVPLSESNEEIELQGQGGHGLDSSSSEHGSHSSHSSWRMDEYLSETDNFRRKYGYTSELPMRTIISYRRRKGKYRSEFN